MDKVVVITGVSCGIGEALVEEFINQGYFVAGCARSVDKLQALYSKYGDKHLFKIVDVSDDQDTQFFAEEVYKKYHKVDILINAAATKSALLPLWEVEAKEFNQVINTNLLGTVNILRAFIPGMLKPASGLIINFSSEWGRCADPKVGAYVASKYAIEGLTKSLAKELPSGMITVALSPLIVYTELLEQVKDLLLPGEYELGVSPQKWAEYAIPFLLKLTPADNGRSITLSPKHTEIRD